MKDTKSVEKFIFFKNRTKNSKYFFSIAKKKSKAKRNQNIASMRTIVSKKAVCKSAIILAVKLWSLK